jgi:TPR repeat protein
MRLLNRAANRRNVRARNRLASMFAIGSCVRRDPLEAYRWMSAALDIDPHDQWAQQNRELMLRQMTLEERTRVQNAD